MILRKPYAFLIKNFRLIHVILTLLLGFIMYQTNIIHGFFKEYLQMSRNLQIAVEPSVSSIPWYIYLAIIFAIAILTMIFTLMNRKKKPTKYYLYAIIFYSLIILAFLFSATQISSLMTGNASLSLVSAARDIMQLFYWGQYIFLFISALRAIGFNLKSFNFDSDLRELNILEEDNEEFEFEVELDSDDIKTRIRRNSRMIKYFILENKIVLVPAIVLFAMVLIVSAFLNVEVYNKIYNEEEKFILQNLTMQVLNSYETTKDYSGNDISFGKYIYYVAEVEVNNETSENKIINLDNIRLKIGEYNYYDILVKESAKFLDFGEGYSKQPIKAGDTNKFIFVFKIDKQFKKETKILEGLKGYDEEGFVYTKVKLNPKNVDKTEIKKTAMLKETLDIEDNIVGKVSLKIDEYAIAPVMEYKYQEVINGKKYTFSEIIQPSKDDLYSKQVLKIKTNIAFKEVYNDKTVNKFISKFGNIRYKKDGKEYNNPFKIKDITPSLDKEYTYLEISSEVSNADEIYLDIIIRTNKYIYKLK